MKDLKSKDSYEELKAKSNPSGNCPSRRRYSSWKRRKRQLWQQRRRQIGCCTMWPDSLPTSLTPDEAFTCSKVNESINATSNSFSLSDLHGKMDKDKTENWKDPLSRWGVALYCWGCSRFVPFPQACVLRLPKQEVVRRLQFHRMRRQTTSCGDTTSPVNFEWLPSCTSVIKKKQKGTSSWMLLAVVQMTPNKNHRRLITPCAARKLTILMPTACEISEFRVVRERGARGEWVAWRSSSSSRCSEVLCPSESSLVCLSHETTRTPWHLDTLRPALPMTFFQKKTQKTSLHRAWSLSGRLLALPLEPGPAPWPSERPDGTHGPCPGCQGGARTSIVGVSKARDKRKYHEIWRSDYLIACDQRYNQNQSEMSNVTTQFLLVKVMTVVEPSVLSPSATALLESGSSHPGEAHVYSEFDASECKAMHPLSHTISHRKSSSYPISTLGQTD